jgi:hypothetical protein
MSQVEGKGGLQHLWHKVKAGGLGVLYHGAAASVAASFVGHYPWFTTVSCMQCCNVGSGQVVSALPGTLTVQHHQHPGTPARPGAQVHVRAHSPSGCGCCCPFAALQYNTLNSLIPLPDTLHGRLLRSAAIGFSAGVVSDTVSNRWAMTAALSAVCVFACAMCRVWWSRKCDTGCALGCVMGYQ